jgi:predicted metallo-beta-lactamase superfamily hydrolase
MCTSVKTGDCKITIDPGIAVETASFPLPTHVKAELYEKYEEEIKRSAEKSDVIVITHYHYDHHMLERSKRLYGGKTLFIKDPKNFINNSQKKRACLFLQTIRGVPREIKIADGESFKIGGTKLKFSKPLWHGVQGTSLGYVIMVEVAYGGEKLLYTSDVDGPTLEEPVNLIVESQPDFLILDGPPTYLLGYIMAYYNLAKSIINICKILKNSETTRLIVLDHHLTRDYRYPDLMHMVYEKAKQLNKKICTAAELQGRKAEVLNGYSKYGPTKWREWRKFTREDAEEVLKKAVGNKLIERKWLEMLSKLS